MISLRDIKPCNHKRAEILYLIILLLSSYSILCFGVCVLPWVLVSLTPQQSTACIRLLWSYLVKFLFFDYYIQQKQPTKQSNTNSSGSLANVTPPSCHLVMLIDPSHPLLSNRDLPWLAFRLIERARAPRMSFSASHSLAKYLIKQCIIRLVSHEDYILI